MAVTALNQPDFRTVSDFRKRHLQALEAEATQARTGTACTDGDPPPLPTRTDGTL